MKKLVFSTAILLCLTLVFPLNAQVVATKSKATYNPSDPIPTDSNVKTGTLENGLTYYIQNNPKPENKVELRLVINAGSILEDEDQLGLAHFMEHMCFNGTKNFEKNELVDYLQSIGVKFGAHLNAYTSFDQTVYILPIPSDDPEKLEQGFQIIEDWAHNALLTDEEIDNERGVVLEEYRLGKGADERMMQEYLPKMMHGSMYAERLPIGTKENLETFKYESLKRFYNDWYRPDLMAVVAVGDIDVATLEEKIKSHFAHIKNPKNPRPRPSFDLPNHEETFVAIESDKEAPFSNVRLMFKDKINAKPDVTYADYRNSIVENLFSQMINNRLDEIRNGDNPPFVYGFTYYGGTYARTKNAFQSSAMTSPTGQLDALKTLLVENERVLQHGFFEGEFERAKKDIIANLERAFKDRDKMESNRIVGRYINNFLEQNPIPSIDWRFDFTTSQLPTISLDEVNALIKSYIKDDNRVVILTGPEKDDLKQVKEAEVLELLDTVKTMDLKPYEDKAVAASLITKMPSKGSIKEYKTDETLGTTTLILNNGATVTYKKTDFKNDEILFDAFSYGGTSLYSDEAYKATSNANGGLTEAGVNGFGKVELSKMMSGKIANVRLSIGTYSEGLSGNTTPKDLETLFQLTHLYFTALNKDENAFRSFADKQKAFLGNLLSSPQFYFQDQLSEFIYGKNPRYTGFPTAEDMDNADYNLAYEKYKERFADAGDFNFYFVGNIDETKLVELCETYLASLPSTGSNESYKVSDFRPLTGSHKKIIEKGEDPKSSVRITYHGPTDYDEKEAHALKSLAEVLSIKLIEKLREEEGGVYGAGANASISNMPYDWFRFNISFPCGPENVDKLITATMKEVDLLIKEGPTEVDLEKVKKAQILDYKEDLKTNKFWLGQLKNADYLKKDAHNILKFEEAVNSLTVADLHGVAKKYLTQGYITGIHNPEQ
ncbi:M16 family metallopeptidase [Winogradskyella psychrotolerans]|uniref:M16 family metallopeptidase n=1 Tax=Winogradskyella psychrotolerans TaxID=1344585 RepID=UPI001C068840|nr:insulinase family protein [Winogradskyella psychrotolerans]MBU2929503.1 insulinase family protein [Winogradskyella psychrotolerans]